MRWLKRLKDSIRGLNEAFFRFPLTTIFILTAAIINAYSINTEKDMTKYLLTLLVGGFISAVFQVLYERFSAKISTRYVLILAAVLLTGGYYFIITNTPSINNELEIKTFVAMFALLIAFIWIPVIKSKVTFNQSFMIAFKAFFISLFFSAVTYVGLMAIFGATDLLITDVNYKVFSHAANIVFVVFFPMYFLSLNPVYLTEEDKNKEEKEIKAKLESLYSKAQCPKMLQVLFSYIIIPLLAVYTFILLLYIVRNLTGSFWEDNLLEPLLVSYAITVIVVYILCSEIENQVVVLFRKVFPKLLIPIVAFQLVASLLTINSEGMTHTRYYVIIFGLFAIASGVLFSLLSVKKNGMIAPILVALAFISIVPPVDAFTVSKNSQMDRLEDVLVKNNMLKNNTILPKASVSENDKEIIRKTVQYLSMMNYMDEISYLPKDFTIYDDFRNVFGFDQYDYGDKFGDYAYLHLADHTPIQIAGHDVFVQLELTHYRYVEEKVIHFNKEGDNYSLLYNGNSLILMNEKEEELLEYELNELINKFSQYSGNHIMTPEEATIVIENNRAKMTLFVQYLNLHKLDNPEIENGTVYVFIQLKE